MFFKEKTIQDPVHGPMEFSPVAMAMIDTPEFQRLRDLKQLEISEYVYPGATNNRFQHSLGTSHLAKEMIRHIAYKQPELMITQKEIMCCELAGLCHDLGHGPYSHLWERFLQKAAKQLYGIEWTWRHENASIHLLNHLVKSNSILKRFNGVIDEKDIEMIENMILGRTPENCNRKFLYQIVNNNESGLDVDKWDYFCRDALYLGLKVDFEPRLLLQNCRVLEYQGSLHICFREKSRDALRRTFENRFNLHSTAYQHKNVMVIETMFVDALIEMEKLGVTEFWKITKDIACDNPTDEALNRYVELTECEVKYMLNIHSKLWKAIQRRSVDPLMYKYAGCLPILPGEQVPNKFLENARLDGFDVEKDIELIKVNIHMGKQEINPVDMILFYKKGEGAPLYLKDLESKVVCRRHFIVALKRNDEDKLQRLRRCINES